MLCVRRYGFLMDLEHRGSQTRIFQERAIAVYIIIEAVVYCSEFVATDPEVPGSIPGATRFSEK
jgi:hypothetical protein